MKELKTKLNSFFTVPVNPAPLGLFRILISSFILLQAFLWYSDWLAFFGPDAWVQWEISKALILKFSLHVLDVAHFFGLFGISEEHAVMIFFWIYAVSAFGLLLGIFTRFWAILTWFCHYIIMNSIDAYVYGVDIFSQIALFYIMVMPVARSYSLDAYFKRVRTDATWGVTLALRVLQIHICLAYLSAGYEKMLSSSWWSGNVMWRSLVQPDFRQYDLTWLSHYPIIPQLLSWFTMIVETGYCIAMWIPRVRVFWLLAMIALHAGIAIFLGLWLFGLIMILLSISAFGFDVWKDIKEWKMKRRNRYTETSAQSIAA